jgi:hypothetical protein
MNRRKFWVHIYIYIYIYTREFYKLARLKKEKGFGQRKE